MRRLVAGAAHEQLDVFVAEEPRHVVKHEPVAARPGGALERRAADRRHGRAEAQSHAREQEVRRVGLDGRLSGIISGAASLTKLGNGALEMTALKTYTGSTAVLAGTLLMNGTNSGSGPVLIDAGATLGGSGKFAGLVTVYGTLAPGNSPGLLTSGSLVLGASATTLIQLTGTGRGTGFDAYDVTFAGGLTYGGELSFDITTAFALGTTLDIFSFTGSYSGGFANVVATGAGYGGFTFTNAGSGIWSNTVGETTIQFSEATGDITFYAAIPEPGTMALAGIGIAAATWHLRRRRRARRQAA